MTPGPCLFMLGALVGRFSRFWVCGAGTKGRKMMKPHAARFRAASRGSGRVRCCTADFQSRWAPACLRAAQGGAVLEKGPTCHRYQTSRHPKGRAFSRFKRPRPSSRICALTRSASASAGERSQPADRKVCQSGSGFGRLSWSSAAFFRSGAGAVSGTCSVRHYHLGFGSSVIEIVARCFSLALRAAGSLLAGGVNCLAARGRVPPASNWKHGR